jgi:hypothetical protein
MLGYCERNGPSRARSAVKEEILSDFRTKKVPWDELIAHRRAAYGSMGKEVGEIGTSLAKSTGEGHRIHRAKHNVLVGGFKVKWCARGVLGK